MVSKNTISASKKSIAAALAFSLAVPLTILSMPIAAPLAAPEIAYADAKSDLDAANQAASDASSVYDEAKEVVDALNADIEAKTGQIADIEANQLPAAQAQYGDAVRQMYMGADDPLNILASIASGTSLKEVLSIIDAYEHISAWREEALTQVKKTRDELAQAKSQLENDKIEADAALADAEAKKQEALDAQSKARAAYQATLPQNIPTTRRAATSSTFYDEASARAFIIMKESGGNYNARNGRYIGAYQLTNTYLNGDYSPENQDRVAENYVRNRYGSWMAAAQFWVSHGWY